MSRNLRDVLRPYREVLSLPGAKGFSAAGLLARLPMSMLSIGIVLLVVARTGSYALAGGLAATFAVVNAGTAPVIARLVDRHGQRLVIPPAITVHAVGLVGLVTLAGQEAPAWVLVGATAIAAAGFPSIGALVRARWSAALAGTPRLHTAFSLESVLDEVVFVVGPPVITVGATLLSPSVALLGTLLLLFGGCLALLTQQATEPPRRTRDEGLAGAVADTVRAPVLLQPALLVVVVAMAAIGAVFGTVEVVTVAFADEAGRPALAGLVLAVYAAGSLLTGLAYGARDWPLPLEKRFVGGCAVMAVTLVPLPFVGSLPVLTAVAFLAGGAIAPTLITVFAVVERAVPAHRLTEGLTWLSTGLGLGLAVGASVAGWLVDRSGTSAAYAVAVAGGTTALVFAVLGARPVAVALHRRAVAGETTAAAPT
jgi:MFS family permease